MFYLMVEQFSIEFGKYSGSDFGFGFGYGFTTFEIIWVA